MPSVILIAALFAFVCFILAAFGATLGGLNLIALGLACLSVAVLVGALPGAPWWHRST